MKTFNPDLAEPVNEDSDAMEMDSFLDRLDKRAKSFRVQMIGDAFKELANVAKEERGKLLQVAVKSFAAELAKSEKEIIKQVCDACETHVAEHKKILAQGEELASKLDKLAKMDFTTPADPMVREVRDALASLRSSLTESPKEDKKEDATLQAILALVKEWKNAPAPSAPQPKTIASFRIVRDDYLRASKVIPVYQ